VVYSYQFSLSKQGVFRCLISAETKAQSVRAIQQPLDHVGFLINASHCSALPASVSRRKTSGSVPQ
jgi:hypothetical protein